MIYSIGYSGLAIAKLVTILATLKVDALIDCRSSPKSRNRLYAGDSLKHRFPRQYQWSPQLGGRLVIAEEALATLAEQSRSAIVMLLCMERAPGDCHRHHRIAVPLWTSFRVDTTHVFDDQLILASELQRSIEQDDYYTFTLIEE